MERLIDVLNGKGNVLHTFPVEMEDSEHGPEDTIEAKARTKALKLAAHAGLVPDPELPDLQPRVHVSRGGPLSPYGDDRHVLAGTRQGLRKVVSERAYYLWQNEGCVDGRADEHWYRALDQHLRERAYFIWQNEGCPEGCAVDHWRQSVEFETYD